MYWADSGDGSSSGQGSIMSDRRGKETTMDHWHVDDMETGQAVEVRSTERGARLALRDLHKRSEYNLRHRLTVGLCMDAACPALWLLPA